MAKNLRWKALAIIAVVAASVFAIVPPEERIKLGLDLRGGVHLVLRVQTDDALRVEAETSAEQLNEQAGLDGIVLESVSATSPTEIRVAGVPPERDQEFRALADDLLQVSYDRESMAGGDYVFRAWKMAPARRRSSAPPGCSNSSWWKKDRRRPASFCCRRGTASCRTTWKYCPGLTKL